MTARKSSLAGLVTQIERGIRREDPEGSAFRTCRTLTEAVQSGGDFLPECFTVPSQDAYARRLVHAGKDFTLMAMVWQGEQGTPLHDHDGNWVVECVYRGRVHVTNYRLTGQQGELHQFEPECEEFQHHGEASFRVPPFEHHILRNAHTGPSVTLHVFGGAMTRCSIFEPVAGGYRRVEKQLTLTP